MKILKRKVVIREYDYNRIIQRYIPSLYTRAIFVPFTLKDLEQECMLRVLSTSLETVEKINYRASYNYEYPGPLLWDLRDRLYNEQYAKWFSEYDDTGCIWIQSKKNVPRSRLGWATFEYDYNLTALPGSGARYHND